MSKINEFLKLIEEIDKNKKSKELIEPISKKIQETPISEEDKISVLSNYFDNLKEKKQEVHEVLQDPLIPLNQQFVTFDELNKHYNIFLQRIQQQLTSLGGGGEVNLRNLDDVDSSTIGPNRHLAYNPTTRKFFFEPVTSSEPQVQSDWSESDTDDVAFIKNKPTNLSDFNNDAGFISSADGGDADQLDGQEGSYYLDYSNFTNTPASLEDDDYTTSIANNVVSVINLPANTAIGPIEQLSFNTSHTHQEVRVPGTLCWDPSDDTLNLTHNNDVVQQIGQESYMLMRNKTGNTILNGEVIRFDGAEMNGTARMLGAPFLADGTYPSLYLVGIATSNITANTDGVVTVTGKVRDLNTTGNTVGETWYSGDILYASPTISGGLTKIKPTAPNNVVPMAAVLRVHETEGEIFVRPTIEQEQSYGRFSVTSDVTVAARNTANVVYFDTVDISRGVIRVAENHSQLQVKESGLYQVDINAQIDATGGGFSSGTMFMWVRVNGEDRENSTRRQGVLGSAPSQNIGYSVVMSLDYDDIVQIAYAGDSTALRFDAAAATAFCPSTAAVKIGITQIQL